MDIAWLQAKFDAATDVKLATTQPESTVVFQNHRADLVVYTWMGAVLYVYLLEKEPRVRELRGILRENSRTGIGTLFMVKLALLPPAGKGIAMSDWQDGLRGLSDSWIYGYSPEQDIVQVHFQPTPIAEQFDCLHLPNFVIEHVSVRRREVNSSLKGDWFLGDIASPAFKRRINYERIHQRFHYTTRTAPREVSPAPVDTLLRYYEMLGLERNASEKEVKSAFRRLAMNIHPDVSSLPRAEAERRIKELIEAYEFIKEYHGWS